MLNVSVVQQRFAMLKHLLSLPPNIQWHYAKLITAARRSDYLRNQYRQAKQEMKRSADLLID
jgi:hypothetical protein